MSFKFLDKQFTNEIKNNVIDKIFPKLNSRHKQILYDQLCEILETITIKFCFNEENKANLLDKFKENNYQDAKGLLFQLLPYMNNDTGDKLVNIRSLNDIYMAKKYGTNKDINMQAPQYEISNIQYGRCKRPEKYKNVEIQFEESHLIQNAILLKQSIQIMSNKLYVNWINIRPYNKTTIKTSELFLTTINKWNEVGKNYPIWDPSKKSLDDYKGLYIGDIYNVINNNLFNSIKNNKWLIYNTAVTEELTKHAPFITLLYSILKEYGFEMNLCVNNNGWNQISEENKKEFTNAWNKFKKIVLNGENFGPIVNNELKRLLRAIIIFFNKYYKNLEMAVNSGEYIIFNIEMDDDDSMFDDLELLNINEDLINRSINSLHAYHMYEYIRDCLESFKNSWYSSRLLNYENGNYKVKDFNDLMEEGGIIKVQSLRGNLLTLPLKLFYNFSKSLIHYVAQDNSYTPFPNFWRSLNSITKEQFLRRLSNGGINSIFDYETINGNGILKWFNITRYLYLLIPGLKQQIKNDPNNKQKILAMYHWEYFFVLKKSIIEIVFDTLIKNGILTYFTPQKEITDTNYLPSKITNYPEYVKMQKKRLGEFVLNEQKRKENWNDAYYYLTNKKYKDLPKIKFKNEKGKFETTDYLTHLYKNGLGMWYTTYAMDWISQIGFFHRYINNRVTYITGSTGVGKSTQVPKLLLYGLKMIDYKYDGNIVCTQPRIPPTDGVSSIVSSQMGTSIYEYNETFDKNIKTNNYNIQFKHQKDSHKLDTNLLSLKFVTDGTLYQELKNSPLLKKVIKNNDNSLYITNKNIYDIVIVDEAHEHNKNMDLILTMMKYTTYYNNDIRLIIVSATMDEDEPIYRRYYREINDNRLYPFDETLKINNLDRKNIDRRLHISPPGETTRFKIDDFYEEFSDYESIIKKILNDSNTGDILLFQPGQGEIIKAIKTINKITPKNVIALPYYSAMTEDKRKFIQDLDDNKKKNLTISKNVSFDSNYDINLVVTVPKNTYDRIIIVATNIAEASITISSLRYVIDTGTQKTNKYDYVSRFPNLVLTDISESSRLQRRGRVGRTASGTVYYLYHEGSKSDIKTIYNIAISDISENIYDLLKTNEIEEKLFTQDNNPNLFNNFKIINSSHNKLIKFKSLFKNGLHNMISKQYFFNGSFMDYVGNSQHYDYQYDQAPHTYFKTGYHYSTLFDINGTFYIIHPEELNLKRNINGEILPYEEDKNDDEDEYDDNEYNKNKKNYPEEKYQADMLKINSFFDILIEKIMIMKNNVNFIPKNHLLSKNDFVKTDFGVNLSNINQSFDIDSNQLTTYLYSRKYKCDIEILKVLGAMSVLGSGFKNLANTVNDNGRIIINIDKLKSIYGNDYSDSMAMIKILNKIIEYLATIINLDNLNELKIDYHIEYELNLQKKIYTANKNKTKPNYTGMYFKYLNKFISLDGQNLLSLSDEISQDEIIELLKDDILLDNLDIELLKNEDKIREWCELNYFNKITVENVIKKYFRIINTVNKLEKNLYDNKELNILQTRLNEFDNMLKINPLSQYDSIEYNISRSLLHGYGYNIVRRLEGSELFVNINNPVIDNVFKISTITPKSKTLDTLLILNNSNSQYLLYLNRNNDNIAYIHIINPKIIQNTIPLYYSPKKWTIDKYNIDIFKHYVKELINKMGSSIMHMQQNNLINDYVHTVNSIKIDFLNNFESNTFESLNNMIGEQHGDVIKNSRLYENNILNNIIMNHNYQHGGYISKNNNIKNNNSSTYANYIIKKN